MRFRQQTVIKLLKNLRETVRVLFTQLWNMSKPCFNWPSKTLHLPSTPHPTVEANRPILQMANLSCQRQNPHRQLPGTPGPVGSVVNDVQSEDFMKQMVRIGRISVYCEIGPGNQWWMVPKMFQNICCVKCWNVLQEPTTSWAWKQHLNCLQKNNLENCPLNLAIHQFDGKIQRLHHISRKGVRPFSHCSHSVLGYT